ncbi:MAG: TRAP transporter large permease [Firmicutes bacterium]|nr:TRAP transporter large permease [Bacillota bacterium]
MVTVTLPILGMIILLALGMPVGLALGVAGSAGLFLVGGWDTLLGIVSTTPYRSVASVTMATIPLFIFMAELVSSGGLARSLFDACTRFTGRLPGGVAIATVLANAGFGAMSGSSLAAAGAMSSVAMPELRRSGYSPSIASGVIAVAGTLAIMIPPSIPLVIYGITTETSIGQLLIAGIVPSLLTALVYSIGIIVWGRILPGTVPKGKAYSWKEKLLSLRDLWGFLIIVGFIFFTLYGGVATPSEVAAIGATITLIFLLVTRQIGIKGIVEALVRTLKASAMIFLIIVGAMIFGYYLTVSQVAQGLIAFISQSSVPSWGVMFFLVILYLILGCLLDQVAILLITLPLTFPLVTSLGYDPIWFGIIVTKLAEIGLITPPVGMNCYVVSGATGVPLEDVFRGSGMMLAFEAITLALLLFFPVISTWLPSTMFK